MNQIFIFSLPRSGSTLLQRVLMSHDKIKSVAEPWILLPQIYSLRDEGVLSEYGSMLSSIAIKDFINNLPLKDEDYYDSLRGFITELHQKIANNGETYFLDKTPRYYLIIEEIAKVFPNAKFIFLFRSPEQIYSSMIRTWSNNRLRPFLGSYHDLTSGFEKLSKGYTKLRDDSIVVRYEDLVLEPEREIKKVLEFLNLDYKDELIEAFSNQDTKGELGDPTGVISYKNISSQSLMKWQNTLHTFTRKKSALSIINKIDENAMTLQGYDKNEIVSKLKQLKPIFSLKNEIKDLLDYSINSIVRRTQLLLFFGKRFKWVRKRFIS
ncbi:MAG: sulfotransferase [Winogradskyella sp.]|uniref:sulfotransferase family protein n=1 Tax=Winogradskyella sp. TaxID=1883156 RepID=UPI0025E58695|nr:sulfotransferase [Winogradskyella sp.]NRB59551.1 sulfotransferase [Winogradskyella sp.]